MIASAFGLKSDLASLRARYPVSLKGATLKGLISIATDLDLETRALRCEVEDLEQLRLLAILHWHMNHFVFLVKCRRKSFVVNDPAAGRVTISKAEIVENFTGVALEVWPGPKFQRRDQRNRLRLCTVIPWSGGVPGAIITLIVLAFGMEAVQLVIPIIQALIIDNALVTGDVDLLQLMTIVIGVFLIGQAATTAVRGIVQRNLSSYLSLIVPAHVFRHLAALPTTWFERCSAADVVNRFDSGNTIHKTLTTSTIGAGIDGVVAMIALGAMLLFSPFLTGIVVVASVAYAIVRILWYSTYRQKSAGSLVQNARVQGHLWETMRGISTIKTFNGDEHRQKQYLSALSRFVALQNCIGPASTGFNFVHDQLFAAERIAIM